MEKQIKREEIYSGKIFKVVKDDVQIDDGKKTIREVVLHNGGVCIGLKDCIDNKYYMVKQYRYSLGKEMLEFCAGKIEKDEDPDFAVLRESEEEVGYKAINVKKLGIMIPTCGYSNEKIHLYYGETGKETGQHLDIDERINVYKYSLSEIKEMIKKGIIDDAKTIAIVFHIEMAGIDV